MTTAQLSIPPKLIPVFQGEADIRGAKGGRGSAKTRTFALMTAVKAYMYAEAGVEGIILCGRQYQNSLDESSMSEVKQAIKSEPWLAEHFEIGEKFIRTRDGRVSYAFAGLERNVDSLKSKARVLLCWVDEAEAVTEHAWSVLIPTLREETDVGSSELWVTWNPKRKKSATNKRFGHSTDPRVKVVTMNWRDNPRFPKVLDRVRLKDMEERPDTYQHIWEGDYATGHIGAYFAANLVIARAQGRIGRVAADPLLTYRAFCDIGGTGARADAFTIWVVQFIGLEIRLLHYYEAVGQPASAHMEWLREHKYTGNNTTVWLPHDGDTQDKVFDVSYRKAFEGAGYAVEVVPNQGKGAAMMRVNAARRMFGRMWFDAEGCQAGLEAVGWYHEKRDEEREIGLGPDHDWSSHGSDSFGLCAVVAEHSGNGIKQADPIKYRRKYVA